MNAHTDAAGPPARMVTRAAETITHAARVQRNGEPSHRDFYALGLAIGRALDALHELNTNIGVQVTHYGDARHLRTNTDRGPEQVLAAAMSHGQTLHTALQQGRHAARSMADEFTRLAIAPDPAFAPAPYDPADEDADADDRD